MKPALLSPAALTALLTVSLFLPPAVLRAAPGDPDLSFGVIGQVPVEYSVSSLAVQADGKILALNNGNKILRLLPNGTLDTTFAGGNGVAAVSISISSYERALAVAPDGRIVVAGSVTGEKSQDLGIQRFTADGLPDTTFGPNGVRSRNMSVFDYYPDPFKPWGPSTPQLGLHSQDYARAVVIFPDGSILVGGSTSTYPKSASFEDGALWHLSATGELLTSIVSPGLAGSSNVHTMVVAGENRAYVAGSTGPVLMGTYAYSPPGGGYCYVTEVPPVQIFTGTTPGRPSLALANGLPLLAGDMGSGAHYVTGLAPDPSGGSLYPWKLGAPQLKGPEVPGGKSVAVQTDGRIVLAGDTLGRLMPDGGADISFATVEPVSGVNTVILQADGKILTGGTGGVRRFENASASGTFVLEQPAGTPVDPVTPAADFGSISAGTSATLTFTVRNPGTVPLNVYKVVPEGASAATLSVETPLPLTVAAGGTGTFNLKWTPTAPGTLNASLRVVNSDTIKRSRVLSLTGHAVTGGPGPEIEVRAADLGGALVSGQTGRVRLSRFVPQVDLTVGNQGTQALHLGAAAFTGTGSAFSLSAPLPAELAAAGTRTVTLRYTPGTQPVSADLRLPSDDEDENPFIIPITGDPSTSSANWRASFFSGAPAGAPTGDTEDYDGDGLPNLLEYATLSSPLTQNPPAATLVKNGTILEYTITRPQEAATELNYEFQWTDNPATGPWKTNGTNTTLLSDDGSFQTVKFTVPAGSSGSRYVRLKVTRVL